MANTIEFGEVPKTEKDARRIELKKKSMKTRLSEAEYTEFRKLSNAHKKKKPVATLIKPKASAASADESPKAAGGKKPGIVLKEKKSVSLIQESVRASKKLKQKQKIQNRLKATGSKYNPYSVFKKNKKEKEAIKKFQKKKKVEKKVQQPIPAKKTIEKKKGFFGSILGGINKFFKK